MTEGKDIQLDKISNQGEIKGLSNFVVKRILNNVPQRKIVFVEGIFTDKDGRAVLILENQAFDEESLELFFHSDLEIQHFNDGNGSYICHPEPKYNGIKTTLIFPATDKHIKKFENQPVHVIEETIEFYEHITLPGLNVDQFNLQWVYNILQHKSEVDRVVLNDEDPDVGFMLLPDLKWDGKQVDTLYLLAIVRPLGIRSIRDLNDKHLPLLLNIKEKTLKMIKDQYGILESQLRIFFHYQPSFYHLHIHFTNLQYEAPGIHPERAHLLNTVINNIQLKSDYYQVATLPFPLRESDSLFSCYESKGIVSRLSLNENNDKSQENVSK